MTFRHVVTLIVGLVMGAGSLWWSLSGIRMAEIGSVFRYQISLLPLLSALVVYGVYFWFKALRWHLLLKPAGSLPTTELLPFVLAGYAGNVFLPLQLGDVSRGYLLSVRHPIAAATAISTIAVEKLLDLLALIILLLVALVSDQAAGVLSAQAVSGLMLVVTLSGAAVLTALVIPQAVARLGGRLLSLLPIAASHAGVSRFLTEVGAGGAALRTSGLLYGVLLCTCVGWLLMVLFLDLIFHSLGADISIAAAVSVLFLAAAGLMLPTSPGFVGTVQAAFVIGLLPFQTDRELAVAASLIYNGLITIPPLIAGVACLSLLGVGRRQLNALYRKAISR